MAFVLRRSLLAGALATALAGRVRGEPWPLRFVVGNSWVEPYAEFEGATLVGGLMFELMQAIASEAGARAEFVKLPAARADAALMAGSVDVHCLSSQQWRRSTDEWPHQEPLHLGPPMWVVEDVLAARADHGAIDLDAERGLQVGTVRGYRYGAKLEALFAARHLVREDATTLEQMLRKVSLGRSACAIVDRLVLLAYNRRQPPGERLVVVRSLRQTQTHCRLGRRADLPLQAVLAAMQRVVENGELQRLAARYR